MASTVSPRILPSWLPLPDLCGKLCVRAHEIPESTCELMNIDLQAMNVSVWTHVFVVSISPGKLCVLHADELCS
jgi:hypothetical protein